MHNCKPIKIIVPKEAQAIKITKIPDLVSKELNVVKDTFTRFQYWSNEKLINQLYKTWINREQGMSGDLYMSQTDKA